MKMHVIFDSTGAVIGAVQTMSEKGADCETGIETQPGQSIQEVEVPKELAKLEGNDLLTRLSESEGVKDILSNMTTAGPEF